MKLFRLFFIVALGCMTIAATAQERVKVSDGNNAPRPTIQKSASKPSLQKGGVAPNHQRGQRAGAISMPKAPEKDPVQDIKVLETITLPAPETKGGMPLMEALNQRKTDRTFSDKELDHQMLSNLLWAAFGINREDGKRTAPTAINNQEIDIYVVTHSGYYYWQPDKNVLLKMGEEDISKVTGTQEFVPTAGLNLVMVYNKTRVKEATMRQLNFAYCDCGYISQNIYLFCAANGLNTVARGGGYDQLLPEMLQLGEFQEIILMQTVGFPQKLKK